MQGSMANKAHHDILNTLYMWGELLKRDFTKRLPGDKHKGDLKGEYKCLYKMRNRPFLFLKFFRDSLLKHNLKLFLGSSEYRNCFLLKQAPSFKQNNKVLDRIKCSYLLKVALELNNFAWAKQLITENPNFKLDINEIALNFKHHFFKYFVKKKVISKKHLPKKLMEWAGIRAELNTSNIRENLEYLRAQGAKSPVTKDNYVKIFATLYNWLEDLAKFGNLDLFKTAMKNFNIEEVNENFDWRIVVRNAVQNGGINLVKYLMKEKEIAADYLMLEYACRAGHLGLIKYFVEEHAMKISQDDFNVAAQYCDPKTFAYVLNKAEKNHIDSNDDTLHYAIRNGIERTKFVVETKKIFPRQEFFSWRVFDCCDLETFKYILSVAKDKKVPLSWDINNILYSANKEIMQYLIETEGLKLNKVNLGTMMGWGTNKDFFLKIMYLVEQQKIKRDQNTLKLAIDKKRYCCAKFFVEKDNIEFKTDQQYRDYLQLALVNSDLETIKSMVDKLKDTKKATIIMSRWRLSCYLMCGKLETLADLINQKVISLDNRLFSKLSGQHSELAKYFKGLLSNTIKNEKESFVPKPSF